MNLIQKILASLAIGSIVMSPVLVADNIPVDQFRKEDTSPDLIVYEEEVIETEVETESETATPTEEGVGREEIETEEIALEPAYEGITEDELETLTILMYLEAGAESDDLVRRVTEVVFNRYSYSQKYGEWGDTLTDIIYAQNSSGYEFSPAPYLSEFYTDNPLVVERLNEIRAIVEDVYMNGVSIPERVMFFRTDHYHQWEGAADEFSVGTVYFSSSIWCEV